MNTPLIQHFKYIINVSYFTEMKQLIFKGKTDVFSVNDSPFFLSGRFESGTINRKHRRT